MPARCGPNAFELQPHVVPQRRPRAVDASYNVGGHNPGWIDMGKCIVEYNLRNIRNSSSRNLAYGILYLDSKSVPCRVTRATCATSPYTQITLPLYTVLGTNGPL